jgi:single-stranded-DNA-specific exonuclease
VDLGRAVRQAVSDGLLLKGGGHAMAAGVTLKKDALSAFRAFLEDALAAPVEAARRDSALLIDGAVSAGGFNLSLAELLSRAGPYGAGNPEPLLALPAHTLAYADPVGENHIRARFRSGDGKFVNAIAFRAAGQPLGKALLENRGRTMHAAGHIAIDRWQGEERVQFRLTDLAAA